MLLIRRLHMFCQARQVKQDIAYLSVFCYKAGLCENAHEHHTASLDLPAHFSVLIYPIHRKLLQNKHWCKI